MEEKKLYMCFVDVFIVRVRECNFIVRECVVYC